MDKSQLKKIKEEDLILNDEEPDTVLTLCDYSWMDYSLKAVLTTKNQGKLDILFNYSGLVISKMIVNQKVNEKVSTYEFEFDSTIFVKHYKEFLLNHMKQWDNRYAFSGENVIIAFFNEVLSQQKEINNGMS